MANRSKCHLGHGHGWAQESVWGFRSPIQRGNFDRGTGGPFAK